MRFRLRLPEGWSSLGLLLMIVLTMAWSLAAGGLAEELSILPWVVIGGVLTGFVFAKARLPGTWAHPLGLAIGVAGGFLLLSLVLPLPWSPALLGVRATSWWMGLLAKGRLLVERMQQWAVVVASGKPGSDPLPFVVQMVALDWLVAFYGAWCLYRAHWVWGAILPAGVVTFLSVYYAPPRLLPFFVLYLFLSLLLIVRSNVYRHEEEWQRHHVVYDQDVGLEFLRSGALLALAVIALVWIVPRSPNTKRLDDYTRQLQGPWQRVMDEWSRIYSSLVYGELAEPANPARVLNLGGGVQLSDATKMEIRAPEAHYWRSLVLDRYTGSGWVDTNSNLLRFSPEVPLSERTFYESRMMITQTVTLAQAGQAVVYAAAEPLRIDQAIQIQVGAPLSGGTFDVSAIYASSLRYQKRYTVCSLVTTADLRSLRQAGTDYPSWVSDRYLQVPADLPPRLAALAHELAAGQTNPYDQALAVESYLRKLRYSQSIEAPPAGHDPVDWFLFESRQGYCTYFSSAMVLMCRSLGVPARLAQGYASGEHSRDTDLYRVRESDAHAWPEVFFPSYGWIEFEPTPAQPVFVRPTGELTQPGGDTPPAEPDDTGRVGPARRDRDLPDDGNDEGGSRLLVKRPRPWTRSPWLALPVALLLCGLVGLAWRWSRSRQWLGPAARLYLRLSWMGARIGATPRADQTPLEFGRSLSDALGTGQDLVERIVRLYVGERFGRRTMTDEETAGAREAWWQLLPLAMRRALQRLLPFGRHS